MGKIRTRKVWLSRQRDGNYMMTFFKPSYVKIHGTDKYDWYVEHGDPIGVRHWCAGGIYSFFGIDIPIGSQVQIRMEVTNEVISV